MALAGPVIEISARTGIHGGGQHESGGKGQRHGGARDAYRAVLQRLSHNLQNVTREFREFIQKEDAVVGQRHFAGAGHGAASNQSCVGDGVVR